MRLENPICEFENDDYRSECLVGNDGLMAMDGPDAVVGGCGDEKEFPRANARSEEGEGQFRELFLGRFLDDPRGVPRWPNGRPRCLLR